MEFGPREVLVVLGALLICGIVLDGVRRMRVARRGSLRGLRRQPIFDDDGQDPLNSELPSGGARVVAVRDADTTAALGKLLRREEDSRRGRRTAPFRDRLWPRPEEDDEMASAGSEPSMAEPLMAEPLMAEPLMAEPLMAEPSMAEPVTEEAKQGPGAEPVSVAPEAGEPTFGAGSEPVESAVAGRVEPWVPDDLPLFSGEPETPAKRGRRGNRKRGQKPNGDGGEDQPLRSDDRLEAVVLHLMAPKGSLFTALPLFQVLQDAGLEFGERHIFHRPPADAGAAPAFSVANAVKPGTFEGVVRDFQTPGLAFFLVIGDSPEPLAAFDDMLATARAVAVELGAELCDERRSALSRQAIADYRQRIADHSRRAHTG